MGEGFFLQREVPPLATNRLETMTHHRPTQNHTVGKLSRSNAAEIRMALRSEPVERTSHVHLLLRFHIEEGQIDRTAAGMSALLSDIALSKEHTLVESGIEVRLHQRIVDIRRPAHEMIHASSDSPLPSRPC